MSTQTTSDPSQEKVSLITLREKKERGEPIVSLTAVSYTHLTLPTKA